MKLVIAVLIAFALGTLLGHFDKSAEDRQRADAAYALILTVNEQPNRAALWRQWRATFDYTRERE